VSTTPPPSNADSTSIVTQITDAIGAVVNLSADALAKGVGLWTAARAAVSTVASGVAAAAVQTAINNVNAKYHDAPLTPATLATAIVRNVLPDSSGGAGTPPSGYPAALYTGVDGHSATVEASYSGIDGNRFAALVGATGMSYGVMDALRLYNRRVNLWSLSPNPDYTPGAPLYVGGTDLGSQYGIELPEVYEVIAHSDVRPEYSGDILKLAHDTISPADAVAMAVKEIVGVDVGQNLYAAAGGIPDQYQALVDASGDAAGIEKAVSLWMHGAITFTELVQVLAMSRVNPRFYGFYTPRPDTAAALAPGDGIDESAPSTWESGWSIPANAHYVGAFEIGALVKAGTISAATALTWMLQEGYPQDQAQAYANQGGTPSDTVKQQTEAMVLDEYAAGMYTEAQATAALENMGYTAASIPIILESAAAKMSLAARDSAVTKVKNSYLHGSISATQAQVDLGELNVPSTAITNYLTAWAVELGTPTAHLPPSEVGWLLERGFLTPAAAVAKWEAMGLGSADASLLLNRYPPNSVYSSANPEPTPPEAP
jgi:hypothetical protein